LFEKYVEVVRLIRPRMLVLENVPGMKVAHVSKEDRVRGKMEAESFYDKLRKRLDDIGYVAEGHLVNASDYGVPQKRSRLIVIGIRSELAGLLKGDVGFAFGELAKSRADQRKEMGISKDVSARQALSDLETKHRKLQDCADPPPGYQELDYKEPLTEFQRLMHKDAYGPMNSMRLARHREDVRERFRLLQERCEEGGKLNEELRAEFGINKHRIHIMAPNEPAPTITTLPDDILHYSEPRILTVRECARLQSFPDWFHFQGKYTTGGAKRVKECPRYTQVGNAVPPLLAKAIGIAITRCLDEILVAEQKQARNSPNRPQTLEAA
jgi:DNA (cytosine-5)-methyltransferase 1